VIERSNSTFNTHTRLITAHAERLGTQESSLHATISVNLIHDIFSTSCDVEKLKRVDHFRTTARTISEEFFPWKGIKNIQIAEPKMTHEGAIQIVVELIRSHGESLFSSLAAVGHRVVHGGTLLSDAIVINETVLQSIENVAHLAPL
jgi:acetate kinase